MALCDLMSRASSSMPLPSRGMYCFLHAVAAFGAKTSLLCEQKTAGLLEHNSDPHGGVTSEHVLLELAKLMLCSCLSAAFRHFIAYDPAQSLIQACKVWSHQALGLT